MSTVSVTNTFVAGTNAVASAVNTNFADLVSYVNTNAILKDGTKGFTAHQPTSAGDPVDATHLARKGYVDTTTNKMSGSLSQLVVAPVTVTAFGTPVASATSAIVIPGTVTEATTLNIWSVFTITVGAFFGTYTGNYTIDVNPDFVGAPNTWTTVGLGGISFNGATTSFVVTPNITAGGLPLYYSAALAGKQVKVRLNVTQDTQPGALFWTITPRTIVNAFREVPFA